jgi:hypothetical protein
LPLFDRPERREISQAFSNRSFGQNLNSCSHNFSGMDSLQQSHAASISLIAFVFAVAASIGFY